MTFELNDQLLKEAQSVLFDRDDIYWIIGGAGSGKSTISRVLAERCRIPIFDMDEYVFGRWMTRYNRERHPASIAWFTAPNPLDWALSLSWIDFDSLYQAANAEYLALLAEDYQNGAVRGPHLIDGGITHPSVLVQAVNPARVVCLAASHSSAAEIWTSSGERLAMKVQIMALEDGPGKWAKFLEFDRLMTKTIIKQSRQENIETIFRYKETEVDRYTDRVADVLGISP